MKWFKISSLIINKFKDCPDVDGEGINFAWNGKYFYTIKDTLINKFIKDEKGYNLIFNSKLDAQNFINKVALNKEIKDNSIAIQDMQKQIRNNFNNNFNDSLNSVLNILLNDRKQIYLSIYRSK